MDAEKKNDKRRHDFARKVKIPPSASCRADMVRRLTREIQRIAIGHIGSSPQHWRDQRARKSLEVKINLRAEVLEILREQNPDLYDALCTEIREER